MKCRICGNLENNTDYNMVEMYYGLRENFEYFQCSACKCLQIKFIPTEMDKFYPSDYSPLVVNPENDELNTSLIFEIKKFLFKKRDSYYLFTSGLVGFIVNLLKPLKENLFLLNFKKAGLVKSSSLLDIGCGTGYHLHYLKELGLKKTIGIDPFISKDIIYRNGVKVYKISVDEFLRTNNSLFDFVLMSHSLEHMDDQFKILSQCRRLLKPHGIVIIRIPVVESFAWKKYRENWCGIMAPFHFYLHSKESLELLAKKSGFKISEIIYDSHEFQFWGSEQIAKGIPIRAANSYEVDKSRAIFSATQIGDYKKLSSELNKRGEGDQATFLLKLEEHEE